MAMQSQCQPWTTELHVLTLKRELIVHSYACPSPPWTSLHGLPEQPTDPAHSSAGPARAAGSLGTQTALPAAMWAWSGGH